jgi:hypothetical protein
MDFIFFLWEAWPNGPGSRSREEDRGKARKYDSLDDATPVRASKAIGAIDPVREMAVVFMLATSAYLLRRYVR